MRHAARALIVGKVVATLEESIDGVRESRNSEVVVVGEGNEVAREVRSQLTVFNFVGELELKADLHESNRKFLHISKKLTSLVTMNVHGKQKKCDFREEV